MEIIIFSFAGLSILLLLGKYIRVKIKFFQKLFIPSSVIGGLIGLVAVQILLSFYPSLMLNDVIGVWRTAPGFLISIVFATLFLGKRIPGIGTIWRLGGIQLYYGQTVAWGQYVVGLGLVLAVLDPLFGVNQMFGALINIGFEGGHGTAAGLAETFKSLGWEEGTSLALGSATIGVFSGVVIGTILINIASRRGLTAVLQKPEDIPEDFLLGIPNKEKRESAGTLTTSMESLEPLAYHTAFIGLAIFIGYLLWKLLVISETAFLTPLGLPKIMVSFPLFPLAMIGGIIIQIIMDRYDKRETIDHKLMMRLHGLSLDFLIVAALSTISVQAIWAEIIPFTILMIFGLGWNIFCVFFIASRIFKDAKFERSIAEFGQSCGVTATGLLLLRIVDPDAKTPALEAFGYKQLLHEPIMGGGLWTGAVLPLIYNYGPFVIFLFCVGMLILWTILFRILFYRK
ncbi:sodium/glutamate symporter [candidate division KSB1 bacterium]